ncbi:MAG: hypothetical protein LKJ48_02825 [Lactobacillus sp.]|jgi:hypothetical protein|nr:hypothetical protein [Lactobacillus sp.]
MNQLEKQLTATDREWFAELREYATFGALLRDETAVDAQLYAMMTDLLAAEHDGEDAVTLFGKAPKEMTDAILKQLPPASWQSSVQLIGIITGISWLVLLIGGGLTDGAMTINLLSYLAVPTLTTLMILGILKAVRAQIYTTVRLLKSRVVGFLVLWLLMMLYIGGTLALVTLMPPVLVLKIPFGWDLLVVGLATAVAYWLIRRVHDQLFTPMAFMALVIGAMTMLRLWWQATHFVPRWVIGTIVVVVTVGALIIYSIWMRRAAKRQQV